jgi:hypothetical protein
MKEAPASAGASRCSTRDTAAFLDPAGPETGRFALRTPGRLTGGSHCGCEVVVTSRSVFPSARTPEADAALNR